MPSDNEYEIEKFIDHRQNTTTGQDEYLIKWKNHPASENSWEPESNLNDLALEEARQFKEDRSPSLSTMFQAPNHLIHRAGGFSMQDASGEQQQSDDDDEVQILEKNDIIGKSQEEDTTTTTTTKSNGGDDNDVSTSAAAAASFDEMFEELYDFCKYDKLSEEGLRQIIERHGWEPNNNPNISDYDFIFEACLNERVTEGIIECLLKYFPHAASATDGDGRSPLHYACYNKNVTLNIVQLLIDEAPNSVRMEDNDGDMPLHCLCYSKRVDEMTAVDILRVLIEKHPEAIQHLDNEGYLPIHLAAMARSPEFCHVLVKAYPGSEQRADVYGRLPLHYACWGYGAEFCRVLIEAYHGSEQITDHFGMLPLHCACWKNTVATVEYLYKLYPNAINDADVDGKYPIHCAIHVLDDRDNPAAAVDVVKFLLDCDPKVILQKFQGTTSLLHYACRQTEYNDSNIETGIQVIKVIYDAHPEAIEDNELASEIHRYHQDVQTFINSQLDYSRQAKDHGLMVTADGNGQLPLHRALQNNVTLGSTELLVQGNPSAIRNIDNDGALPLHIACQHHESARVVQYLLGLHMSKRTLRAADFDNNTALHYACRGAKYETIALLLEKYDAAPVSKRNAHEKLPIHLLLESDRVEDRESIEYMESIFRLLRAYPEPIVNCNAKQQAKEKRKFEDGNETGESADECSSSSSVGY